LVDQESIDKICQRILEDGEKEISSIIEKAEQTAADIREKAGKRGDEIAEKILKEAGEKGESAQRRLLSSVSLEVKRAKLRAREEVIASIQEKVEDAIRRFRDSEEYPRVLTNNVAEAVRALNKGRFLVYVDPRDVGLLKEKVFPAVLEMMDAEGIKPEGMEAKPLEETTLGGARISVLGGNVIFDNTFEARLYRLRNEVRHIIFEEVFSVEESDGKE
jgi:vacuolar-type H+-ATPase subunit E/Vma4